MKKPVQGAEPEGGKSPSQREALMRRPHGRKLPEGLPRKAAIVLYVPVPKTDTGRKGEEPKAGGRSIVKELGKMAP